MNPYANKLAGPCARCSNYYLKKRASQKVYCSRRCGNATTATIRTREQRRDAHEQKLRLAAAAAQKWKKAQTRLDWKEWVSRHESGITSKFLTRAVNKGELKAPARAARRLHVSISVP
jgi:predicted GIY-YIG superfamily endonuclease